jgi:hypothetical protein
MPGVNAAAADVISVAKHWGEQTFQRRGEPVQFPEAIGPILVDQEQVGEITAHPVLQRSGVTLWSLGFAYPDSNDGTLRWNVACDVAASSTRTEFSIVLRLESVQFNVKPITYPLGTPRVVRELVQSFDCRFSTRLLTEIPQSVTLDNLEEFSSLLADVERRGPIVLISLEPFRADRLSTPVTSQAALQVSRKSSSLIGRQDLLSPSASAAAIRAGTALCVSITQGSRCQASPTPTRSICRPR